MTSKVLPDILFSEFTILVNGFDKYPDLHVVCNYGKKLKIDLIKIKTQINIKFSNNIEKEL